MQIPAFWYRTRPELVEDLFSGPDDVRAFLFRITEEECMNPEAPPWWPDTVRGLKPQSRQFLAQMAERAGIPLVDSPENRAMGFFGDWVPEDPVLELSGK